MSAKCQKRTWCDRLPNLGLTARFTYPPNAQGGYPEQSDDCKRPPSIDYQAKKADDRERGEQSTECVEPNDVCLLFGQGVIR